MTIEYTYPEQGPTGAFVRDSDVTYGIAAKCGEVKLPSVVSFEHVPEVCQAMMRLAGKDVEHACAVDVGKRIVERLQKYIELHDGKTSDEFQDGVKAGYRTAMAVAHEESGYDL